jgi:uncharacterized protein (TIGR03437 family)
MNRLIATGLVLTAFMGYAQVITTVAGTDWVFRGDGRLANSAPLGRLWGIAVDSTGNIFAADGDNAVIVKVSLSGALSVVAGNGLIGFSGDGGPARNASLAGPRAVAVDRCGNLYIAEMGHRVRRVDTAGIITTIVGTGLAGYGGDGGPATAARLFYPSGLVVDDAGTLYIADSFNHRIRKVDNKGIITTLAGDGFEGPNLSGRYWGDGGPAIKASFNRPQGIAVDDSGELYIADMFNNRVRKIDRSGVITTAVGNGTEGPFGDGGLASNASLNKPTAVTVDRLGSLYIADRFTQRIRKVERTGLITALAGNGTPGFSGDGGPALEASLNFPNGVTADAHGAIYVADTFNGRIRKIEPTGRIVSVAGNGEYRISGDGGPASSASLNFPRSVAVNSTGEVYIADQQNRRIRKINLDGAISTVAGGGGRSPFDVDHAMLASFEVPSGIAVDKVGSLYIADRVYNRVFKVAQDGRLIGIAGNGRMGFMGDGVSAIMTALNLPTSVAVDTEGRVYIADLGNHRVRRVDVSGIITTVAGNGMDGFSGDGDVAVRASLSSPGGVTADEMGGLYIADTGNGRVRRVSGEKISTVMGSLSTPWSVAVEGTGSVYVSEEGNHTVRKVSPNGPTMTLAGNGSTGFSGDGGPADRASLNLPAGIALDAGGNVYIADSANDRVRKVLAKPPISVVTPATLRFNLSGEQMAGPELVAITSAVAGLAWSASASVPWITASLGSGTTPGLINVAVNPSNLSPGTYRGTLTVTTPLASPSTHPVSVELTVLPTSQGRLEVDRSAITFDTTPGSGPLVQTLRIGNRGNDTLSWIARAETLSGGNWLHLSATSGSASASSPTTLQVRADASGLAAGVYSGLITVESPGSPPQSVAVDLLLSQVTQSISVSQTALQFTAVEGEETAERQKLAVVNSGQGVMNWTVRAETVNGGNWLVVSPSSGQSEAGSILVPEVDVSVNARGLRRGTYAGLLQVSAPGAANSPRLVTVTLTVLAGGSKPGTRLSPPGLIFTGRVGSGSPSSQLVRLTTSNPEQVEARGQAYTVSGGDWLQVLPTNLVVSASDPRTVVVQPVLGNLAPGEYRGALTYQFSDGSPTQAVNIYFVVVGGTAEAALSGSGLACAARKLVAVDRSLGPSFKAEVGAGTNLEVQVVDDCGNAVDDATVVATFSNGDQAVTLTHLREGIYAGIWRPLTAAEQVTVTLRISQASLPGVELLTQGKVEAGAGRAVIFPGGIVNGASYAGGALAPGSIVSLFGRKLSTSTATATSLPLSTSLGGIRVQVGGVEMPLFYTGEGQINAQLPFELTPNTRPQVVVKGADFVTAAETITVAAARPGIFTLSQDGKGQGAILDSQGRVVDSNNPAAAGEVVAVYCTGLGATNPAVSSGQPAPGQEPLARVTVPVEATVGGKPARVQFAGLAPGFVGLYQVNVQIPEGLSPGASVTVVLRQNDTRGNPVALAVR